VLVLNGGLLLLLLMLIRCLLMLLTENTNANAPLLMSGAFVPRIVVVLERKVQGPCSLLFLARFAAAPRRQIELWFSPSLL
jgi:hypothetical protein